MADHDRPALRRLAARCGVLDSYRRADNHETAHTTDLTRELILSAMGLDAGSESAAERAIANINDVESGGALEPFASIREHEPVRVRFSASARLRDARQCTFRLVEESGKTLEGRAEIVDAHGSYEMEIAPAGSLPIGYHRIEIDLTTSEAGVLPAVQTVAVVPLRCFEVSEALGADRGAGVYANLYTVAGSRDWGFGDFGVLAELASGVAAAGGDFLGINPLHTRNDRDRNPSPYLPSSRLYLDPLYIDIGAVPELANDEAAWTSLDRGGALAERVKTLRARTSVDYAAVSKAKHEVLRRLYTAFNDGRSRDASRFAEYERFVETEGSPLERFATHRALEEHFASHERGRDWRQWPTEYRDPASPAVRRFAEEHADEIAYESWLQYEAERQLDSASSTAVSAGMSIGLLQDLAVGSAADGADAWAFQNELAHGATMGAPPDDFSTTGQEWGVTPMIPHRMGRSGFSYWRRTIERMTRYAGALRIDHAMGLMRQFWVPSSASPLEGAYVAYPADSLLGILALESVRRRVVVIGEDLGTVPEGFRERMGECGLLRTLVMYFERRDDGSFRTPNEYARDAIAVANTHDLPTLAGFWNGDDLAARFEAGQIPDPAVLESARAHREAERYALDNLLVEQTGIDERTPAATCDAVTRLLAASPSSLLGVSLDDVAGERESINIPGTTEPARKNWTRRMSVPLDRLVRSGRLSDAVRAAKRTAPR